MRVTQKTSRRKAHAIRCEPRTQNHELRAMNNNHVEIAYILDRSGSMAPVTEAAIAGFNHFLRDQQQGELVGEGIARLTPALGYQIAYTLGWKELRPVQVQTIDAVLDGINLRIAEACVHHSRRLIQFSSCEVYGKTVAAVDREAGWSARSNGSGSSSRT